MKRKNKLFISTVATVCLLTAFAGCSWLSSMNSTDSTGTQDSSSSIEQTEISLSLDKESVSLSIFETATLTASTDSTEALTWASSDNNVLTVAEGVITPVSVGTAKVIVSVGGKTDECEVTVTAPTEGIVAGLDEVSLTLNVNEKYTLTPWATYGETELSDVAYTFTSSDANVVAITEAGEVTAIAKGNATVTVGGTYKGAALTACELPITVSNVLTLESGFADNKVTVLK